MTDTVTGAVVFTDLVGFTQFNDAMGDAAAVEVLDRQLAFAGDVLAACDGGRVVKELGDGLMLWIPDAVEAIGAASAFVARIDTARDDEAFPLAVRLGLHHGEVVTRHDDLVGRTVNVASRIADLAGPGELLVSEEALAAAGGGSDRFEPVGPTTVKGVAAPIWLYRATDPVSA
jgi:class 3 adenylate cyclase